MSDTFKVGEVAIYVRTGSSFYGREIVITGPLFFAERGGNDSLSTSGKFPPCWGYSIKMENISIDFAEPHELRKKRSPEELSSWDKVQEICGWSPRELSNA